MEFDEVFDNAQVNRESDQSFGKLIHYTIRGLFGSLNHSFHLERREPTILTGVNGTGKSTVLRTIDYVSKGAWDQLAKLRFEKLNLHFENANMEVLGAQDGRITVRLESVYSDLREWTLQAPEDHVPDNLIQLRNAVLHGRADASAIEWLKETRGENWEDYLLSAIDKDRPRWTQEIPSSFPALLVSDRRLADSRRSRPKKRGSGEVFDALSAIEAAFLFVDEEVQRYRSLYATTSQALDRDFPHRVLTAMHEQPDRYGTDEFNQIQRDLELLGNLQQGLSATGLMDAAGVENSLVGLRMDSPGSLPVIDTYLKDTIKKLVIFEPLRERLEPFILFLRRHYRNKDVRISEGGHLSIVSKLTQEKIPPTHLSSGEQQILILAHKILFGTAPGTLVMIDEPELSLHVLWQATFIDDLTEISSVTGCHFILATHSPTLIAGRNDLRRSLDG